MQLSTLHHQPLGDRGYVCFVVNCLLEIPAGCRLVWGDLDLIRCPIEHLEEHIRGVLGVGYGVEVLHEEVNRQSMLDTLLAQVLAVFQLRPAICQSLLVRGHLITCSVHPVLWLALPLDFALEVVGGHLVERSDDVYLQRCAIEQLDEDVILLLLLLLRRLLHLLLTIRAIDVIEISDSVYGVTSILGLIVIIIYIGLNLTPSARVLPSLPSIPS